MAHLSSLSGRVGSPELKPRAFISRQARQSRSGDSATVAERRTPPNMTASLETQRRKGRGRWRQSTGGERDASCRQPARAEPHCLPSDGSDQGRRPPPASLTPGSFSQGSLEPRQDQRGHTGAVTSLAAGGEELASVGNLVQRCDTGGSALGSTI